MGGLQTTVNSEVATILSEAAKLVVIYHIQTEESCMSVAGETIFEKKPGLNTFNESNECQRNKHFKMVKMVNPFNFFILFKNYYLQLFLSL